MQRRRGTGLIVVGLVSATVVITYYRRQLDAIHFTSNEIGKYEDPADFEGFDNETGTTNGCYIVPNIVHFIRFHQPVLTFIDAICVLAAFKNQKPDKIIFHTNLSNFTGKYWSVLLTVPGFAKRVSLETMQMPESVFGQTLSKPFRRYHAGDVARVRVLMKYGGIYLDNDSYIVRSLNDFRRYEMTIGWREGGNMANQVIVAHKNARFLKAWMESYRGHYDPRQWYYNAGIRPTQEVLVKRPELVHRVKKRLAEFWGISKKVFTTRSFDWRDHYAIHLLINHQRNLLKIQPVVYTDENVHNYQVALKDMAYDVYPFNHKTN